jgi:D-xylose 1-dehydrogenase
MTRNSHFASYPSLKDRGVLISGGATGIGATLVTVFAQQGARVCFIDVAEDAAVALIDEIGRGGVIHTPVYGAVDVTDLDACISVIGALDEQLGGIDVLVNNAANDARHKIEEVTPAIWRAKMAVNLDHQFFAAQTLVPGMRKRGRGSVINMGSCSWRLGLGDMSAYVTAKAAIEGLTNGLARELGPDGIRVNCVIPGFIRTERQMRLWLTPDLERIVLDGQCLKTLIDPEYVANLVAFLAADDSRMCSSGTYTVDGGWI